MKQKIKLIASDLDGTLLQNHMQSCSEKAIRLIQELTKKDILFVPASGRQYFNLYNMFKEVQGDLMYLCENGSLVMYHDEVFLKHQFERELALEISHMVMEDPQSEVLMSGERTCYIVPKNIEYVSHLRNYIKNDVTVISKPEDKPARHRKKQFSFRNFKEDLKTFIPHPAEHPDEKAQTTSDNSAPAVESNRKTEDSSSEQSKK